MGGRSEEISFHIAVSRTRFIGFYRAITMQCAH